MSSPVAILCPTSPALSGVHSTFAALTGAAASPPPSHSSSSSSSSSSSKDQKLPLSLSPAAASPLSLSPSSKDASNGNNAAELHQLECSWTFWFDKRPFQQKRMRGEKEAFESNLREIGSFSSVEDFWRIYNHLVRPCKIEMNANYSLFKSGIKPMWEDDCNRRGGKWVLTCKSNPRDFDKSSTLWDDLTLAMIGETLDSAGEVCGAVFSRRKAGDRIALWTRDKTNKEFISQLRSRLVEQLPLDDSITMEYQNHEDSIRTGNSYAHGVHIVRPGAPAV